MVRTRSQTARMATVFETNPFGVEINPATTAGLKLYQAATAARSDEDLLSLTIAAAPQFIDAMNSKTEHT